MSDERGELTGGEIIYLLKFLKKFQCYIDSFIHSISPEQQAIKLYARFIWLRLLASVCLSIYLFVYHHRLNEETSILRKVKDYWKPLCEYLSERTY